MYSEIRASPLFGKFRHSIESVSPIGPLILAKASLEGITASSTMVAANESVVAVLGAFLHVDGLDIVISSERLLVETSRGPPR